jgi:hypothetical protein
MEHLLRWEALGSKAVHCIRAGRVSVRWLVARTSFAATERISPETGWVHYLWNNSNLSTAHGKSKIAVVISSLGRDHVASMEMLQTVQIKLE